MTNVHRRRRVVALLLVAAVPLFFVIKYFSEAPTLPMAAHPEVAQVAISDRPLAIDELNKLEVKDRAPKTGYSREEFGNGWANWAKCDTRQKILIRDFFEANLSDDNCTVLNGKLNDPYTGKLIEFTRGSGTSSEVQIDHVVALSNAWQTGAQYLEKSRRVELANDDLELLAVEGKANQQKSDADAATWLPSNKAFRCQYVARQIAVKVKYVLWVTGVEYDAIKQVLETCPGQPMPAP
jgi:hypothetical protein